ncbi:MAG: hypothetical protein KAX65_16160, partial [Caldilineaceae bacterium]|nr:hypothetical protein [Caldilineaceae bacterium]
MAQGEHEQAVRVALRSGDELKRLIDRLGTQDAPRGRILAAYRQARRAMRQAQNLTTVLDVLRELRATVEDVMRAALAGAAQAGADQARVELAVYGLPNTVARTPPSQEMAAWLAQVDAQAAAVQATWMATGDMAQIVGDEERVGILTPAPIIREGARWLGIAMMVATAAATAEMLERTRRQEDFMRQAVAAIDERTTDCCLRVHGQVVGQRDDFHLTGTPRFAEYLRNPPFHWYCRSSTCLVRREDANDPLSQQMRSAAALEIGTRAATGTRVEIHPADARSS